MTPSCSALDRRMSKRKEQKKKKHDTKPDEDAEVLVDDAQDQTEPLIIDGVKIDPAQAEVFRHLESQQKEAEEARLRALADFRNFQRRSMENEIRARQDGAIDVVRVLLPVLDHFDLALNQEQEQLTLEQLYDGVKIVRDELTKVLAGQNVEIIQPETGTEFDPVRHEAMMKQPAEGVEPNHIVTVMQVGYMMGDVILRPAKVSIAPPTEADEE